MRKNLTVETCKKPNQQLIKQLSFSDLNECEQKLCLLSEKEIYIQKQQNKHANQNDIFSKNHQIQILPADICQKKFDHEHQNHQNFQNNYQDKLNCLQISRDFEKVIKEQKIIGQKEESAKTQKHDIIQPFDNELKIQKQKSIKDQIYQKNPSLFKSFSFGSSEISEDSNKQIDNQSIKFNLEAIDLQEQEKKRSSQQSYSFDDQQSKQNIEKSSYSLITELEVDDQNEIKKNNSNIRELRSMENNQEEEKIINSSVKPLYSDINQSVSNSQIQDAPVIIGQTKNKIRIKKSKTLIEPKIQIQSQRNKKKSQLQILVKNLPIGQLQKNLNNELEQIDLSSYNRDILSSLTVKNKNQCKSVESLLRSNLDSKEGKKMNKKKKLNKNKKKKQGEIIQTLKQLIDQYENKLEQKQTALEFFKQKVQDLEFSLDSNKIFLNMVVHDMRNPTNQMEFMVSETLVLLKELKSQINDKFNLILEVRNRPNQDIQQNEQILESIQAVQREINQERRQIFAQIEEEKEQNFRNDSQEEIIQFSIHNQ